MHERADLSPGRAGMMTRTSRRADMWPRSADLRLERRDLRAAGADLKSKRA